MKTLATIILAAAFAAPFTGGNSAHRARIIAINSQLQQTPQFQYNGSDRKTSKPRNWLEIEAEIEVETTHPSGFIPELKAEWFAIVMDKYSRKPVRLTGTATFRNVRTTDRSIYLSAYIEPDTLERLTGEKKPSENDIEGFALKLAGPDIVTEGKHGSGLEMATAEQESKWWKDWQHNTLEGMVVPKSETPFAPLWTDRYPRETRR